MLYIFSKNYQRFLFFVEFLRAFLQGIFGGVQIEQLFNLDQQYLDFSGVVQNKRQPKLKCYTVFIYINLKKKQKGANIYNHYCIFMLKRPYRQTPILPSYVEQSRMPSHPKSGHCQDGSGLD
eukprot:TRINITY_DN9653_c0_g2_i1.p5 TRINITY_DN9653_c0_g2~~TRINITY_DN9653_c0_g2_i1.p5  ORF type:complete len:122 (-),score=0.11 TRINITY_DN9653_c0_g2_i1:18-383(-)